MQRRMIGLLAALTLVLVACSGGQDAGGTTQAIGVHGAWTIEVVNVDGSVAERVEFSNDLQLTGEEALSAVLSREWLVGSWVIELSDYPPYGDPTPCLNSSGTGSGCNIWDSEATGISVDTAVTNTLTVSRVETTPGSGSFDAVRLAGSIDASNEGVISVVHTYLQRCLPTSPHPCGTGNRQTFTMQELVDPSTGAVDRIQVSPGQSIQVEVVLSFGTLR